MHNQEQSPFSFVGSPHPHFKMLMTSTIGEVNDGLRYNTRKKTEDLPLTTLRGTVNIPSQRYYNSQTV
ncbi:hypothetical protein AAFF_G00401350 [Aldrovandia affinis]|uniref:Uncharacterized protein n=1 Tax=Aldrovandia affinis TaxID=143900 RepID=A0AAD7SCG3_9TELE|nr:hypothetical protein AAFF_G00401350 [Aldrovandia affinis]